MICGGVIGFEKLIAGFQGEKLLSIKLRGGDFDETTYCNPTYSKSASSQKEQKLPKRRIGLPPYSVPPKKGQADRHERDTSRNARDHIVKLMRIMPN